MRQGEPVERKIMKIKIKIKSVKKIAIFLIALFLVFIFLVPVYWMIISSLKDRKSIFQYPPVLFPKQLHFENYMEMMAFIPFFKYAGNTLFISLLSTIGLVMSCSTVAYALSKLKWKGRQVYFIVMLSTMLLPYQAQMIPLYMLFKKLGWIGTFLPLIVPNFFGAASYIFLLRQFMIGIPKELTESAFMDGAGHFRIFTGIILPLIKPALFSVALFAFFANWSDLTGPLIFLNKEELYTLTIGLTHFRSGHGTEWGYLMCACVLFSLPIAIIYFFTQKQFIEGVTFSGIKG